MTLNMEEPRKVKIQLPKDALKKINLGQSFAEYDKLLLGPNVFVRTPSIEAATHHLGQSVSLLEDAGQVRQPLPIICARLRSGRFSFIPNL